jgi:hypothetical protein
MTRSFTVVARASRITQPMSIVRPREPDVRRLGFSTFRLHRSGNELIALAHVYRRNTMAAFLQRMSDD